MSFSVLLESSYREGIRLFVCFHLSHVLSGCRKSWPAWPYSNAAKQLLDGCNDLAFSPYGEYWRQVRKICVIELLSGKRVQPFTFIREEVGNMIKDIKDSYSILAINLINMFTFGKKYTGGENGEIRFSDLAMELLVLLGSFGAGDYFPSFGWMDVLSGLDARLKRISQGMDDFLDQLIEDHLNCGNVNNDGNDDEHR
ncbi:cytochrome P450 71A1-like [Magnolia sinica]|uniref:cytochrome P450 71A1-like n=1 Tax=Magnolia sinica TaxID=86752 RepID=UPI002657F748|nr:cytochrome P450 71A1-like [Magnolia sinica]